MEKNIAEKKREIDIEFRDVCFEFLRRWRIIVVAAVTFAIVFGAVQYRKDYIKANTPAPAQEEVKQPTLEETYADLNKDEMERVIAAVQLVASIDARSLYMNESVLMSINPYSEDRVTLQYFIDGEASENIAESYKDYINSGSVLQTVKEEFDADVADEYLAELITVSENEKSKTNNFSVKIVYSDSDTVKKLADAVQIALEKYHDNLIQNGQVHNLVLVNKTEASVVDADLAEKQDKYANDTLDEQSELSSIKSDMNTSQLVALFNMARDIFPWDTDENQETIENQETQEITPAVKEKVSINVSQVMVGAVVGTLLAIIYIFFAYLTTGKVRTKEEINNFYQIRVLGEVFLPEKRKNHFFSGIDNVICRLERRGQKQLSFDEQLQMVVSNIVIWCEKNDITKISLTGSIIENVSSEYIEKIQKMLMDHDVILIKEQAIGYHPETLLDIAENGAVVFIEERRKSYYREIVKEIQLCAENEVSMLGVILLEE